VVEVRPGLELEAAAFWYELGADAARAAERLAATPVAVESISGQETAPLIEALEGAGGVLDPKADLQRYLPLRYCYLHVPSPSEEQFCHLDPNGHVAGNCLEEAILQGLLELVERDAVGIWWYNRVPRPEVALETFEQPYFLELAAHYRDLGYRLWVLDATNDIGIPVFVALAHSPELNPVPLNL
jgi:hypothetical protein